MDIQRAGDDAPIAVGAYIFAGGFSIGVTRHFNTIAHLEESHYGVKSSQTNFPGLQAYTHPPHWPIDYLVQRHDVSFVYCNPPCALFSQAGATMRGGGDAWRTDPRQRCWRNCFVAFEAIRPKAFVIESVVRAFTAGRPFIDDFAGMAGEMGYAVTHLLVDARNYGMAQRRKRYFMVLHRVDIDFALPDYPIPTVNEILATVKDPGHCTPWVDPTHEVLLPFLEHGQSFRAMWEQFNTTDDKERTSSGGVKGRPRIFIHRVNGDGVIGTITGDYFVHPTEDRFLGINELKVLNGFPEDYFLEGSPGGWASLISRGVCPNVADWLAGCVRRGIDADRPAHTGVREVDLRAWRTGDERLS